MTTIPVPPDEGIRNAAAMLADMLIENAMPLIRQGDLELGEVCASIVLKLSTGSSLRASLTLTMDDAP